MLPAGTAAEDREARAKSGLRDSAWLNALIFKQPDLDG